MPDFERSAAITLFGVTLAHALAGSSRVPDQARFFVLRAGTWHLIDVAAACRAAHATPPMELTHTFYALAHHDRITAAARALAALRAPPPATPGEPEVGPPWWNPL